MKPSRRDPGLPPFDGLRPAAIRALASAGGSGSQLAEQHRAAVQPVVGGGLQDVRIHTGKAAAATAESLQADAFTIGRDVFFGQGKFDPGSARGRALLAHELVHVRQQTGLGSGRLSGYGGAGAGEAEAEVAEQAVLAGDQLGGGDLTVGRYVRNYASADGRPLSLADKARLDAIALQALAQCKQSLGGDLAELTGETIARLQLDLSLDLAALGDDEAAAVWGRALAELLRAELGLGAAGAPARPAVLQRSPQEDRLLVEEPETDESVYALLSRLTRRARFRGVTVGRINGDWLEYGDQGHRYQLELREGSVILRPDTVSAQLGGGVFYLKPVPLERLGGLAVLQPGDSAYDVWRVPPRGRPAGTGLLVKAVRLGAIAPGILAYSPRTVILPEVALVGRLPQDTVALAEGVIAILDSGDWRYLPGQAARRTMDLLRNVTNEEMMDVLERLVRAGRISDLFHKFIRFGDFREFLRNKGVEWSYVFGHRRGGVEDNLQVLAGFLYGVGEGGVDFLRLIGTLAAAPFDERAAREVEQFWSAIKRFFAHPLLTAVEGIALLIRTFEEKLWNLEFFEAGRIAGNIGLFLVTLPGFVRSLPRALRALAASAARLARLTLQGIRDLGVSLPALEEVARQLRFSPSVMAEGFEFYGGGVGEAAEDVVVVNRAGRPVGRIPRSELLRAAEEGAGARGRAPRAGRGGGRGATGEGTAPAGETPRARAGRRRGASAAEDAGAAAVMAARTLQEVERATDAAARAFRRVYDELKSDPQRRWSPSGRHGSIFPDRARYPTLEIRSNGDVLGSHRDVTRYLDDAGLAGRRTGQGGVETVESHHLLEDHWMEAFGITRAEGRAVALTALDHAHFSAEIPTHLPRGTFFDIDDIFDASSITYRQAGHPEWVEEMRAFLNEHRDRIMRAYEEGRIPHADAGDLAGRKARVRSFLDGLEHGGGAVAPESAASPAPTGTPAPAGGVQRAALPGIPGDAGPAEQEALATEQAVLESSPGQPDGAGNSGRGVAGTRLQRRAMPDFTGRPLGSLSGRGGAPDQGLEIIAGAEVVPPDDRAGRFGGFDEDYQALVFAQRHPTATAVVRDAEGRYHVFDTGLPALSTESTGYRITPNEAHGYQLVRWVNLVVEPQPSQDWTERVDHAFRLYDQYRAAGNEERARTVAEEAFVALIVDAAGVARGEVHVARSREDRLPGVINFDLEMDDLGQGGIASLPTTRAEPAPVPTLTLGRQALRDQSYIPTQMTLAHEATHLAHARRGIELLETWRGSGDRRSFEDWLSLQLSRRRISPEDYTVTTEQLTGGRAATESLACLEGFMSGYHVLQMDLPELVLFKQLIGMAAFWPLAGRELQESTVQRLRRYYGRGMDERHRRAFDDFVARKLAAAESSPEHSELRDTQHLYRRLTEFAGGGRAQ